MNFDQCLKTGLFFSKPVWAFKSKSEAWEALIIKWTTSGEPPVWSKSHQDSKRGHSWSILLVSNWLPPCMTHLQLAVCLSPICHPGQSCVEGTNTMLFFPFRETDIGAGLDSI